MHLRDPHRGTNRANPACPAETRDGGPAPGRGVGEAANQQPHSTHVCSVRQIKPYIICAHRMDLRRDSELAESVTDDTPIRPHVQNAWEDTPTPAVRTATLFNDNNTTKPATPSQVPAFSASSNSSTLGKSITPVSRKRSDTELLDSLLMQSLRHLG